MTTSPIVRRSLAALVSGGAAAALTLIPAVAQAQVSAQFEAVGEAGAMFTGSGGADCTLSSGDDNPESPSVAFHHGTKHRSVNLDATFTNTLDSSDKVKVKGHVDSAMTLKRKGGDLSALDLSAGGAVTISHTTTGSQCLGSGELFGSIPIAHFTESKRGTFTVTWAASKPGSLAEFVVVNQNTEKVVLVTADIGGRTKGTTTADLKPGEYEIGETEVGIYAGAFFDKSASLSHTTKMTVEVQATFKPKKH